MKNLILFFTCFGLLMICVGLIWTESIAGYVVGWCGVFVVICGLVVHMIYTPKPKNIMANWPNTDEIVILRAAVQILIHALTLKNIIGYSEEDKKLLNALRNNKILLDALKMV